MLSSPVDDIIKVKPKNTYEWHQDQKNIHIRIPIKGTSLKKIDIFLSDVILKVNCMEKNFVKILDLSEQIDYESKDNRVVYTQEILEISLI